MSSPAATGTAGYRAALEGAAVEPRPDRARLVVTGRDPVGMLQGLFSNRVPEPGVPVEDGSARGRGLYSAVLTPKGRMVADLRVLRSPRPEDGLLLDLPAAARAGLLAHFAQYVPPRFARTTDVSERTAALTLAGPHAAALLTREALGLRVDEHELAALAEHEWVWVDAGEAGPLGEAGVLVVRSGELVAPSYDLIGESRTVRALHDRLLEAGALPLEPAEREALRVEAGRPAWGAELDEQTLPPEAGIEARAIDQGKGCYTGQEVIVRIRDRGHVNRHLRGLKLRAATLPAPGAELWAPGRDRPVGTVTSAAASPRAGGLALGYVRHEVTVPGELRVGGRDGPTAAVLPLGAEGQEWWRE